MRFWLFGMVVLLMACVPTTQKSSESKQLKVLTPDWGIAGVLTAIGNPPVAVGDVKSYATWSRSPALPDTVVDLGVRFSPNPELMAQLSADLVIDNDFYQHLRPMYGQIPVHSVNLPSDNKVATWQDYVQHTVQIGKLVGYEQAAQQYVSQSKQQIAQFGQVFQNRHTVRRLMVVQFANATHFRAYAKNSLFEPALLQMGLELYTFADGNAWGYIDATLADLAKLDQQTCLVVIEPFSKMLQAELANNAVWQHLKFGQVGDGGRCMMVLPPTWISGGLPSMVGFAKDLSEAVPVGGAYVKP